MQSWALLVALATFVLTLHLPTHFDYNHTGFQFEINRLWIVSPPIHYHLGIDGLSVWLVVLTGFLAPIGVLASWRAIDTRVKEFYSLFLLQQTAMLGVFLALDLMVYYAFWELTLVPMAILIAIFGREPRQPQQLAGGDQVLPLHLHSLGALPGRHPRALRPHRHLRLPRTQERARSEPSLFSPGADVDDLAFLPGRLRREGPRLPVAWLAR